MSEQQATLLVFDAERCCGTILPGKEPCSYTLCFDGIDDGLSHRVSVSHANGVMNVSHGDIIWNPYMRSWLSVVANLSTYVRRLRNGSFDINDEIAEKYNVRLMDVTFIA